MGKASEHQEASVHKAQRQRIPPCYFNGFKGRRHHDLNGGDPDVSAKATGHSKETKARYYKKVSYEEAEESYARHHPAFVERW